MIVNDIVGNLQFPLIEAYQVTEKQSLNVSHVQPWPWNPEFLNFLLSFTLLRDVEVWSSLTK